MLNNCLPGAFLAVLLGVPATAGAQSDLCERVGSVETAESRLPDLCERSGGDRVLLSQ